MIGNRVFGHALILGIATALIFTPWGSLGEQEVFGWQGQIALGKVPVAYWMICACLVLGSITSSLNFLGWTQLSSVLMFALFGFAVACSSVAVFQHYTFGSVGTGAVLAIGLGLIGIAISPADEPHRDATIKTTSHATTVTSMPELHTSNGRVEVQPAFRNRSAA